MSCKNGIFTSFAGATAVPVGGAAPLGGVTRRYGPCIDLTGNGVTVSDDGYYLVSGAVTITATAAGPVTATLFQDGVAIPSASASVVAAAAGDVLTATIPSVLARVRRCNGISVFTIVLTGTATTVSASSVTAVQVKG